MVRGESEFSMGTQGVIGLATEGAVPTAPGERYTHYNSPEAHAELLGPETVAAHFDHSLPAAGPGKWGCSESLLGKAGKGLAFSPELYLSLTNPSQFSGVAQ